MGRYVYIALFAIVLVAPISLRWVLGRNETVTQKDALELVIISPHGEPIRREFARAFSIWHKEKFGQPVDILYQAPGGAAEIQKMLEAKRTTSFASRKTYDIDLAWGGGDTLFDRQLKPHLEPLELPAELIKNVFPSETLSGLRLYEGGKPPLWYGTALSSFGISYNRDVLRSLKLPEPKTWSDLADPRFAGWVVLADPTRSSSAKAAFMIIVERAMVDAVEKLSPEDQKDPAKRQAAEDSGWADGMGMVRLIASNARAFNDGSQSLPGAISAGDVAAGMTIDFYARSQIQAVGEERMGYIEPFNATIINPDPIALLKGAPHRELAVRFIEFVLSDAGQRLWNTRIGEPGSPQLTALRRLPIRKSIYSEVEHFSDRVNPFEQASSFVTSRSRTKTFSIVGEFIQCGMIDLLDDLRATRKAIEASPKKEQLKARLARFPFDQKEALKRFDEYDKAKSDPAKRLLMLREWTAAFKAEYRTLREEAAK